MMSSLFFRYYSSVTSNLHCSWGGGRNRNHSSLLWCWWKHAFLVTWPYARLRCPPFSQPGAFVLHLYLGDHDVGILVPAAPSNLYHAVSIANRFTLCSGGPRVQGIGSQLSPCRSSLYCQTVKLCSTTGTVAKPQALNPYWFSDSI